MRYASIRKMDISNGEGVGVSLFVQGCPIHCEGCFNQSTWDFDGGKEFTGDTMNRIDELLSKPYIKRFSILGGEPLAMRNRDKVFKIVNHVKTYSPQIKIWLYTGFTWENLNSDLVKKKEEILTKIISRSDVMVDGPYAHDLRDPSLKFRGSSNQRVIDIQESLKRNEVVLYKSSE